MGGEPTPISAAASSSFPLPRRCRSQPPRHNPGLGTTRGASKEGGGRAPPSPLSRRVWADVRGSFFVLGLGQRPATAVGRHSCRSGRAPSSAAAWCVAGGPRDVHASGGVGGAWTLDPVGERLQEAGSGSSRKRTWRRRHGGCARWPFGGGGTTGQYARRPSAAAHGARWPDPAVEVVCTRRSGPVAVPDGLSATVQRLGGVAVAASRGQPGRPSGLGCSSFPLPPSGSGGGGYVASTTASGRWRC
jgi:hypothetical protein